MSYLLAVDWGTTWTAAAVSRSGTVEIAPLASHETLAPSVAHLDTAGVWTYGEAARRRGAADPVGLARHVKRRFADPTPLVIQGEPIRAEAVAAGQIGWVLREISGREGRPPDTLCLTHPAPWSEMERSQLREIGESLHPDVRLLSEPEAVAVHYGTQERVPDGALVAIYDFGGGTFDATVLARRDNGFEILGVPVGVGDVGGVDLDAVVMQLVVEQFGERWGRVDGDDAATRRALERLRRDVTVAKETLSTELDASVAVDLPGLTGEIRLTRSEVEERFRPLVERTMAATHEALASAAVTPEELHAVLLAGGSSRIPLVGEIIAQRIGRPVAIDVHPKLAVALGAARALEAPPPPAPPPPTGRGRGDAEVLTVGRGEPREDALPLWLVGAVLLVLVGLVIAAVVLVWPDDPAEDVEATETTTSSGSASSADSSGPVASAPLPDEAIGQAAELDEYLREPMIVVLLNQLRFEREIEPGDCQDRLESLEQLFVEDANRNLATTPDFDTVLLRAPATVAPTVESLVNAALAFLPLCAIGAGTEATYQPLHDSYVTLCSTTNEVLTAGGRPRRCGESAPETTSTSTE